MLSWLLLLSCVLSVGKEASDDEGEVTLVLLSVPNDRPTSLANSLRSMARMRSMSLGTPATVACRPKACSFAALVSRAVRKPCLQGNGCVQLLDVPNLVLVHTG